MFKGKLIDSSAYYRFRSRITRLIVLSLLAMVVPAILNDLPGYVYIILFVVLGLLVFWELNTILQLKKTISQRSIHIDASKIVIINNDDNAQEEFWINKANKLTIKDTYQLPEENLQDFLNEIKNNNLKNYLIYEASGQKDRFDFVIDSHYMVGEIKKIVQSWKEQGIPLQNN